MKSRQAQRRHQAELQRLDRSAQSAAAGPETPDPATPQSRRRGRPLGRRNALRSTSAGTDGTVMTLSTEDASEPSAASYSGASSAGASAPGGTTDEPVLAAPPLPPRRPVGRPRGGPDAPPPPGALPARDVELRVTLMRSLGLKPEELRPPRGSWRRLMAGMTAHKLKTRVAELAEALGPQPVSAIARKCPAALLMTPERVLSKLDDLNLRLRLPRQSLLSAVSSFPALLVYSPEAVGARVTTLVQELGRPEDYVLAMVVTQPVLLGLAPATLRHRVGRLHEMASLLPGKWGAELASMSPACLGRLLRCSDSVMSRLLYTYLRTANNGRKWERVRAMATILCRPRPAWHREQPLFQEWLLAGEADRADGLNRPWPGWADQPPPPGAPPEAGQYDWWGRGGLGVIGGGGGGSDGWRGDGGGYYD